MVTVLIWYDSNWVMKQICIMSLKIFHAFSHSKVTES